MGAAYQKGMVLLAQGRYSMAADEFRRELAEAPENWPAMAMLATALLHCGQFESAWGAATAVVANAPDFAHGHCVAAHVASQFVPRDPSRSLRARFDLDQAQRRRQRYEVAKRFILEAIRLDSGNVHYWSTLAGLEAVEGAWGQSLEAAEQGLALEAQDATCAQLRASALIALGRAAEARQVAAGVLAEDPEDAAAHLRLGWFDLGHGRRDAAERHFRETLRREPKNVAAAWALRNARLARFVPYLLAFRVVFWVSGGMPGLLVATFGALLGVTCWVAFRHDGLIVQRHLGWIALAEGIGCLVLFRPVFTLFLLFDPASRRRVPLRHRVAAVAVGAIAVAALCVWLERMTRPNRP